MQVQRVIILAAAAAALGLKAAETPAWIAASNRHAQVLLELTAKFNPENAAALGVEGVDDRIIDLKPGLRERRRKATEEALAELQRRLAEEKDPLVRQDLQIMVRQAEDSIRGIDLYSKYEFPYVDVAGLVFGSTRGLLDDQVAASRRTAAVTRLRRYAGLEPGYTPITVLAEQRTREQMSKPGLTGPARAEVEKDLENSGFFIKGIAQLFQKYQLQGWEEPYAKLKEQVAAYDEFVRKEVLPKSRADFRLPPELYAFNLRRIGVDIAPAELVQMAHAAYDDIQKQMQELAPKVAKEKGFKDTDYRAVIRALKNEQLGPDQILPHYKARIAEIETVLRRENLVTVPDRPARMRLATPAESAQQPAPHMRPPRLVGNTGESGEFVLPLVTPSATGKDKKMDDFTFAAASYTLTAHEARPGHEMQFSAMMDRGVSTARAVFAFNSTNVEGWGLYAERIMFPYMPPECQLISLNMRLLRAARAFLDPELHMGKITPEQAYKVLRDDVSQSDGMATQEVERYTFRMPGQATSYFYGYSKLNALRDEVEKALGPKFNARQFHDFILSQGLLPPAQLRAAVLARFVEQPGKTARLFP